MSYAWASKYAAQPLGEVLLGQQPNVIGVQRVGLLLVEPGRIGVDVDDVEGGDHLVEAEHVAVVGDRPAKQRQVIQQTLGDEAAVAMQEQVGLRVALRQLLGALAEHGGQVPELRNAIGTPMRISAWYSAI